MTSIVLSGRPSPPQRLRELVAQHRADRAVDVAHRQVEAHLVAGAQRPLAQLDQRVVQRLLQAVVLRLGAVARGARRQLRHREDRAEVHALGLPVPHRVVDVEHLGVPHRLGQRAEAQLGQVLAHLLRDEPHEVDDVLGPPVEPLAQLRVLRGDADRARVEVADAHHDAAAHHQRGGGEAELLGAQQRGDDDVAAGLELAVGLHHDPVAQTVAQQGLLGLGQPQLPRPARVLDRAERDAPVPPSCPEISTTSE